MQHSISKETSVLVMSFNQKAVVTLPNQVKKQVFTSTVKLNIQKRVTCAAHKSTENLEKKAH